MSDKNLFDDDDALDYILYEDVSKNDIQNTNYGRENNIWDSLGKILLWTNPLGWILMLMDHSEKSRIEKKENAQKVYFDSLNPTTKEDLYKIDTMDGHEFEYYVARVLEYNGFEKVEVTSGSNDFGVDILAVKGANKYAIQVKRQSSTVSRRAVSDAIAGAAYYSCNKSMVVTNSRMSKSGLEFARSTNCIVIQREKLIELIERAHS